MNDIKEKELNKTNGGINNPQNTQVGTVLKKLPHGFLVLLEDGREIETSLSIILKTVDISINDKVLVEIAGLIKTKGKILKKL